MITEFATHSFKSWQDTTELQIAPLTGFFGANNSGKTSILQALLLLKQTAEYPRDLDEPLYFGDEESPVNLVDFDTIIHRHNLSFTLYISVSWQLPGVRDIIGYRTNSLSYSTNIVKNLERSELWDFHYTIDPGHRFGVRWGPHDNPRTPTSTPKGLLVEPRDYMTTDGTPVTPFRCYGITDPVDPRSSLLRLQKNFENLLSQIYYLGPRRADPRRYYTWKESHPKGIGQYGEKMISALLSSRVKLRSTDEQIMERLRRLKLIDSYTLNPISDTKQVYNLLVKQYEDGTEIGLTDVGFSVSQVLPVLILCYYAPEGSILILEQPEAHLHPKAQSELADVLIDVVKTRNIQIILESHSEHLLLRLLRRIAEYGVYDEGISADQTAFYFCEINDGNSKAEQLKVDEYGNISNWPRDFFGDEMGDLAAKTKAEMQRRKANKK